MGKPHEVSPGNPSIATKVPASHQIDHHKMAMFHDIKLTMKLMAVMEHGQKSHRFSLRLEGLVPFSFGKEGFYNVSLQK